MKKSVKALISHYQFDKIPVEGTLYKSTYVSSQIIDNQPHKTAILGLYCHEPKSHSTFHRLRQDEMWHFYDGDPFHLHLIYPKDGRYEKRVMGQNILQGQVVQLVIPAGTWQAGELSTSGNYALFGCTLSPGFTGASFEAGTFDKLMKVNPDYKELYQRLCPPHHEEMPDGFQQ